MSTMSKIRGPRSRLVICHSPFAIRHPPFAIRHRPSAIGHPPSAIRHSPSAIRHLSFIIRHLSFIICHLSFIICHLSFIILCACAPQPLTVTREPVTLRVVASDSCGVLLEELADAYEEACPWVTVRVEVFNAAVAEARLRAGAADLVALPWRGESPTLPWSVPFATDATVVVVHPAAPIQELSLAQLQEIIRGRVGEWENGTAIQVVSREEGAGTRAAFEAVVMGNYDVTLTAVVMPGNEQVLEYVATTPGAIGYVSLGTPTGNARVLPVGGVFPTPATVSSYPLAYPLLLATPSEPTGEAREFIQWVLGPEGQQRVTRRFAPPSP